MTEEPGARDADDEQAEGVDAEERGDVVEPGAGGVDEGSVSPETTPDHPTADADEGVESGDDGVGGRSVEGVESADAELDVGAAGGADEPRGSASDDGSVREASEPEAEGNDERSRPEPTEEDRKAHRSYLLLIAVPVLALVIGLVVVLRDGGVPGLDDGRDRWDASGPASYTMTYEVGGMAGVAEATVVVLDGVVDTFVPAADAPYSPPILTVTDLFAAIDDADAVDDVEFDPVLGHPVRASLDVEGNAIDDEWSFTVISLEPTD